MAEFPPNLDDGELWLPSEIFPDVGVCHHRHRQPVAAGLHSDVSYVDELAEKLAAFGLLDSSNLLLPAIRRNPHLSDRFRFASGPVTRFGPVADREAGAGMVYDGFRSRAAARRVVAGWRPVFPFSPAKPAQFFGPERTVVPVRTGGSGRECGGTGVFLPRVINNEVTAPMKKKSCIKDGGEQRKQLTGVAAMGMQGMPFHQAPPPEMGLPQDWTY
ncbi:uncharacterized protein LOC103703142 [Phoenix dactylifera]|uniref:Uncharacterized protein LOC103703142 n=1 Tax=Phoenix dactylifera TaxID=42345 RepID=A0A8B7BRW7_PHODC|nr:uncharacterized protein LOC103703142 [Phoenix dactylifera]